MPTSDYQQEKDSNLDIFELDNIIYTYKELPEVIKQYRKDYKFTLYKLSKAAGVQITQLKDIEAGKANVTVKTAVKILRAIQKLVRQK